MQIIKLASKGVMVDFQTNQLTFLDNRFYRSESGQFWPSVTTYLEAYPKNAQFYEWLKKVGEDADAIRDEAGRKGSAVHEMTERYDNGEEVSLLNENGYIGCKLAEWAMFEKYVEFRTSFKTAVIHNELNLVSDTYRMGGTLDRVMTVDGQLLLVDIKTSNAVHPHYWLQLAAYERMLQEKTGMKVDGVAILWLAAKTRTAGKAGAIQGRGWQLCVEKDAAAIAKSWRLFQSCQTLWLAENEDNKPRQTTYQLSHKQSIL
jgi:hypothetical protein